MIRDRREVWLLKYNELSEYVEELEIRLAELSRTDGPNLGLYSRVGFVSPKYTVKKAGEEVLRTDSLKEAVKAYNDLV